MPSIQYLSELEKFKTIKTYRPIVLDLSKPQLELLIMLLINGCDLDYSFDIVMSYPKEG